MARTCKQPVLCLNNIMRLPDWQLMRNSAVLSVGRAPCARPAQLSHVPFKLPHRSKVASPFCRSGYCDRIYTLLVLAFFAAQ